MKKLSITFLLLLTTFMSVSAQEKDSSDYKKITYGLKGGLNLATPSGYISNDTKSKLSYHVGAFAEIRISEKFAIQPELQYSVQGAEFSVENAFPGFFSGDFVISDTYRYINLPIMFKYFVIPKLSLEIGPQLGYMLSADRNFEAAPFSPEFTDDTRRIDFGVNFGLGYKLSKHLSIGARYNLGLSKVANSPSVNQSGFGKLKNSVFQASLAYSF